ncbi:MAG: hypothetical protein ACJ76I_15465 [Gaiellaceae bacterium]
MRVTEVLDDRVLCDDVEVMAELVGEVAPGDELLVQAGVALVILGRRLDGAGQL